MWSSYRAEENGVCIAYTSIYGNTKEAAELTRKLLSKKGVKSSIYDLARCDIHEAVASAFKYNRLVLASPTYNCGIFPPMREFINCLTERNYQNRTLSFIENGSWSPMAIRMMKCMLCNSKNLKYTKSQATIISTLNDQSRAQIELLANELVDSE